MSTIPCIRICPACRLQHKGKYSNGGFKCSQYAFGQIKDPQKSD